MGELVGKRGLVGNVGEIHDLSVYPATYILLATTFKLDILSSQLKISVVGLGI